MTLSERLSRKPTSVARENEPFRRLPGNPRSLTWGMTLCIREESVEARCEAVIGGLVQIAAVISARVKVRADGIWLAIRQWRGGYPMNFLKTVVKCACV